MNIIETIIKSLKIEFEDQDSIDALCAINLNDFNPSLGYEIVLPDETTFYITFNRNANPSLLFTPEMQTQFFKTLDQLNQQWLYSLAFQHYSGRIKNTRYGTRAQHLLEKHNGDEGLANQELFGIYKMDEVAKHMKLIQINIGQDHENATDTFTSLRFDIPWDEEHGLIYRFKNMEFLLDGQ